MNTQRSRTPLIIGIIAGAACLVVAVILVIAVATGGFLVLRGNSAPEADGGPVGRSTELVAPPGVADDQPYLGLSTSADGPVVDVYLDFLCPHCKTFQQVQGEDITAMADAGEITLRVHPRPMLDANSTPPGYSGRAANAALCAYAEDQSSWPAVEAALFEEQPGAEGLEDEDLVAIVDGVAGTDIAECQAAGTYIPWLEDVVEPEARESTSGTPTVLIDGEVVQVDFTQPGAIRDAVEAA